ncbi:MAG: enoyl-CoA hydratase/isomerase family protein [Alphaproteobacteria bacterium]|nr:enoyl-CoA hydratase/isomerase family protein [Alphaproteobacteria bacterium]
MPDYETKYDHDTMAPRNLEHIRYEKKGNVAYVTINRPEVRNALHTFCYQELRACWRDISIDPSIFVAILTGAGEAFSAGRDVKFLAKYQAEGKRTPHEDPTNPAFVWGGGALPSHVPCDKPIITAINGLAVGIGLSLALSGHLRVMAEEAWISDTHTLVGRLGSPQNLYFAMPRAVAAYLTLANGRLSAQECLQYGIVNKVVPRAELMPAAEQMAEMVCRGSPLASQAAVKLYRLSTAFPEPLIAYQRALDKETAESEDGAEGPRAFREKRKPMWKGR